MFSLNQALFVVNGTFIKRLVSALTKCQMRKSLRCTALRWSKLYLFRLMRRKNPLQGENGSRAMLCAKHYDDTARNRSLMTTLCKMQVPLSVWATRVRGTGLKAQKP